VNYVFGYRHLTDDQEDYTSFQRLTPVATAGNSIFLYRVSPEDADRLNGDTATRP